MLFRYLLTFLFLASNVFGADYYVDGEPGGDCAGNYSIANRNCTGSDGNSYDSPQDLSAIAAAGDNIYFRGGTYRCTSATCITPANSGSSGNEITWTNYENETAIIDGSRTVTGWSQYSGNVYQAAINFQSFPSWNAAGVIACDGDDYGGLVTQEGVVMNYCLTNNLGDVDEPGEWHMSGNFADCSAGGGCTLYVYGYDLGAGYDLSNYTIKIGEYRDLFDFNNVDYHIVDGITIQYSQDNLIAIRAGSDNIIIRNCTIRVAQVTGIYWLGAVASGTASNNLIQACKHGGIEWLTGNINIDNNTISCWENSPTKLDASSSGCCSAALSSGNVGVDYNNINVTNNVLGPVGTDYDFNWNVRFRGDSNTFTGNTIFCNYGAGIAYIGGANAVFRSNIFHRTSGNTNGFLTTTALAIADSTAIIYEGNTFSTSAPATFLTNYDSTAYTSLAAWETALKADGNTATRNRTDYPQFIVSPKTKNWAYYPLPNYALGQRNYTTGEKPETKKPSLFRVLLEKIGLIRF